MITTLDSRFARTRALTRLALALLAVLIATSPTSAQITQGSIAGTVTDPGGAVIPNAQITAVEMTSQTTYTAVTTGAGYFVLPDVRVGTYTLTTTATGFGKTTLDNVVVSIGQRTGANLTLQVGKVLTTVEVNAQSSFLESESSDVGTNITPEEVVNLPLPVSGTFRSLQTLAFLAPASVGPGTNAGTTYGQVAGGQSEGSDYLLDGLSTLRSENGSGFFDQTTPSVESVQEFRVLTAGLPAEYGRTTGGIANFGTKSGGNSYHGTVYEIFKNRFLDANDVINNHLGIAKPADSQNDYGLTMGGPLQIPHLYHGKDRTFFFFSWEQFRLNFGGTALSDVPTLAERGSNGSTFDFSSLLGGPTGQINPCTGQPILQGQIFDPSTTTTVTQGNTVYECRTPYMNNMIPITDASAVAQKILAYIPLPNLQTPVGLNNFQYVTKGNNTDTAYSFRIDQNLTEKSKIFGFFSSRENASLPLQNLPGPVGGGNLQDLYGKYFRLGWVYTITPNVLNSLTVGSNRINSFNGSVASFQGLDYPALLGITGTSGPTFPAVNFNGPLSPASLGADNSDDNVDNGILVNDSISLTRGHHSLKFGGEARYQQFSEIDQDHQVGDLNFYTNQTAGVNSGGAYGVTTGNAFASFLIGQPGDINRAPRFHQPRWITHYYALFAQDDYKVSKNLVLNLGIRWSVDTPRSEAEGGIASLNPTLINPGATGVLGALQFGGKGPGRDGNVNERFADIYYKNFNPRVGFAWAPDFYHNNVVFRGAYGIYNGPLVYADYGTGLQAGFTATNENYFNPDGFLASGNLDAGFPAGATGPNFDPAQLNGQSIDYVAKSFGRPSETNQWSFEIQTQIAPDLVWTQGYIGSHSTHLHALLNYPNDITPNYLALGSILNDPANSPQAAAAGIQIPYPQFFNTWGPNVTAQQTLRPFPQYGYINTDSYLQNSGQSSYEALTEKVERRFRNGLTLLFSYTFSKTLTDADSIQPYYSTLLSQGGTQNPFDQKAEKAVSNQDVPQNVVISYLYNLPIGRGRGLDLHNKVANAVFGGIRVGGIQRYTSGQPLSFYGAYGIPGFDNGIRFDRVPNTSPLSTVAQQGKWDYFGNQPYFNAAAFVDPNQERDNTGVGPYRFGTMPRNSADIRWMPFTDEDMQVAKIWKWHEGRDVEFRGELFNAFNRHIFSKPDTNPHDVNFGLPIPGGEFGDGAELLGPRRGQLTLKIHY